VFIAPLPTAERRSAHGVGGHLTSESRARIQRSQDAKRVELSGHEQEEENKVATLPLRTRQSSINTTNMMDGEAFSQIRSYTWIQR
jgi:hypothetical protein